MADLIINPALVGFVDRLNGIVPIPGFALEPVTAGQPCYPSFGNAEKLGLCDADDHEKSNCVGIFISGATAAGDPVFYAPNHSVIAVGALLLLAELYFTSDTAGKIRPYTDLAGTSGQNITSQLGFALDTQLLQLELFNVGIGL